MKVMSVSQDKRTMIIQEILYWKKNKLLPEHYCDFLLNLYGSDATAASSAISPIQDRAGARKGLTWVLSLGVIAIISIIGIYFNAFPLPMQITSGCIGVSVMLIAGIYLRKRHVPLAYLSLGTGCLLMLWIGEWLLRQHGWDDPLWALGYLIICCAVWLVLGVYLRLTLLQLSGWLGLTFVYGWLLWNQLDPLYGVQLQTAWGAIGVLFLWFGWLTSRLNRSMTRALLIVAILSWIAPEIMSAAYGSHESYLPQAIMVGKIIFIGIIVLMLRHKWIGWVKDQ